MQPDEVKQFLLNLGEGSRVRFKGTRWGHPFIVEGNFFVERDASFVLQLDGDPATGSPVRRTVLFTDAEVKYLSVIPIRCPRPRSASTSDQDAKKARRERSEVADEGTRNDDGDGDSHDGGDHDGDGDDSDGGGDGGGDGDNDDDDGGGDGDGDGAATSFVDAALKNIRFPKVSGAKSDKEVLARSHLAQNPFIATQLAQGAVQFRLEYFKKYYDCHVTLRNAKVVSIWSITRRMLRGRVNVIANEATFTMVKERHVDVGGALDMQSPSAINRRGVKKVIILAGESGSGKTFSALISCRLLRGVAVLMVTSDFHEYLQIRDTDDDDEADEETMQHRRNTAVKNDVRKFLKACIKMRYKNIPVTLQPEDVPITLILDEMGDDPKLVKAICRTRAAIRRLLHENLTLTPTSNIRLIVAGTGVSYSTVARGSDLSTFRVVHVAEAAGRVWTALKKRSENGKLQRACDSKDPSPAATALNNIAQNSRCAALIARALRRKRLWKGVHGTKDSRPLLESQLWHLYYTAVHEFKFLNSFECADPDLCEALFSRAFFLHLSGHDADLSARDHQLIAKFGILTDTAVPVAKVHMAAKWTEVPAKHFDPNFVFAVSKGTVRYSMSPAAVQLGMSCFGCLDVVPWEGFARNIAQIFQQACTAFCHEAGREVVAKNPPLTWFKGRLLAKLKDEIFPTLPSDVEYQRTQLIKSPCQLEASDILQALSGPVPVSQDDETHAFLNQLHALMAQGNILVVINGSSAAGPDVIVLASNWYVGVQCEMTPSSQLTRARAGAEMAKMLLPSDKFTGVQHCCIITAGMRPPRPNMDELARGAAAWSKSNRAKSAGTGPAITAKKWKTMITKMVQSGSTRKLHFIYLGDDTTIASWRARPFWIPFAAQSTSTTIQTNSNSAASLQQSFDPANKNLAKP
jgi:hypothetical protein